MRCVILLQGVSVNSSRFVSAMDEPRGRYIARVPQQRTSVMYMETGAPKYGTLVLQGNT